MTKRVVIGANAHAVLTEALLRDILLTRTTESFGPMIAEWALARALAISQQLAPLAADQRERKWQHRDVTLLRGTRAVIVGTGDVGSHVGRLFRALGCVVHGISRSGAGDPPRSFLRARRPRRSPRRPQRPTGSSSPCR